MLLLFYSKHCAYVFLGCIISSPTTVVLVSVGTLNSATRLLVHRRALHASQLTTLILESEASILLQLSVQNDLRENMFGLP